MDPDQNAAAWRWAAGLMACRTESEAATHIARAAGQMAGAEAARVWIIDHERGYRFAGAWPEERDSPDRPPDDVARAIAFAAPYAATAGGRHRSRLVIPLLAGPRPFGAVELLEKRREAGPFVAGDATVLASLMELAKLALARGEKATAKEHARKARDLTTCDGPRDYTHKAAYDEVGALLEELEQI